MPRPITLVDSGGMPITQATWGEPMTPVDAPLYGEPMTLVDSGGVPVVLVEDDLSPWLGGFVPGSAVDLRFDIDRYRLNSSTSQLSTIDGYHSRASSAWRQNASGVWTEFATGVAPILSGVGYDGREGVVNAIPDALLNGITSTATLGAVWSLISSGTTITYEGKGTEDGVPYVDVRIQGLASGDVQIRTHVSNTIVASTGQTWHSSIAARIVAGSLTGISSVDVRCVAANGGSFLDASNETINVNAASVALSRTGVARTLVDASATRVEHRLRLNGVTGNTIDVTLRIAMPQLTQTPYQMPFGSGTTASDTLVIPAADAGMAVNPSVTGLTIFWRGTDFESAASFSRMVEVRADNNNRFRIQRNQSNGQVGVVFNQAGSFTTRTADLVDVPRSTEFTALATWRADGSWWLKIGSTAAQSGTDQTPISIPIGGGVSVGNSAVGGDVLNHITRRAGFLPTSLSDADALALFNAINTGL